MAGARALTLRQNTAPWDRAVRTVVGAALIVGSPMVVRGPYWLTVLGALGGALIAEALTGY
jgi:hypothetical protein